MPRRPLTARVSLWLPPLAYMALIFYFSSQPNPLPAITSNIWDKLLHTIEYAGLAVLLGRTLRGEGVGPYTTFVVAVLLASAYGATDEYHQLFVTSRRADIQDWMVDTLGAALGAAAVGSVLRGPIRLKPDPTSELDPASAPDPTGRSSTA